MNTPENKGTYAAVRFHPNTNTAIHKYLSDNGIPNAVRPDQLHTTILFSRKHLPTYKPAGLLMMALYGTPGEMVVWESSEGDRCLVLPYKCEELEKRHRYLMDLHKATYDFPEYRPHITLSYDIGDIDIANLPDIRDWLIGGIFWNGPIVIVEEYGEDLSFTFASSTITINKKDMDI